MLSQELTELPLGHLVSFDMDLHVTHAAVLALPIVDITPLRSLPSPTTLSLALGLSIEAHPQRAHLALDHILLLNEPRRPVSPFDDLHGSGGALLLHGDILFQTSKPHLQIDSLFTTHHTQLHVVSYIAGLDRIDQLLVVTDLLLADLDDPVSREEACLLSGATFDHPMDPSAFFACPPFAQRHAEHRAVIPLAKRSAREPYIALAHLR